MLNQRCKWLVKSQLIFSNQSWKATKITLFELNELKLSCYQLSINFAFLHIYMYFYSWNNYILLMILCCLTVRLKLIPFLCCVYLLR